MIYGTFFAVVILILDEKSDPRLLGKMISLASFFITQEVANYDSKDARGNEFLEFIPATYINESEAELVY